MSPIDLILSAREYEAFLLEKRKKEENKRRSAFYFSKSSGGVVVRALAAQQWSPGSIPGFSPGSPVVHWLKNLHLIRFDCVKFNLVSPVRVP